MSNGEPRVYSYIRMSNAEQRHGDSLRRQTEAARQYAEHVGLQLDESLIDIGKSAFDGTAQKFGALSKFLSLVEDGKIAKGSILIVENLDRLSRENVMSALNQFIAILEKDISIYTTKDNIKYNSATIKENYISLIISIIIMSRAYEESVIKGQRVGAAWQNKRKQAIDGKKMTAVCPYWIRLVNGNYELINDKANIVREIFKLTISGLGRHRIAKLFNEQQVPTFNNAKGWQESYIQKILENRSTFGEFQAMRYVNKKRTNIDIDGSEIKPISNYYPAVITENVFYEAYEKRMSRKNKGGQKGSGLTSIISGLCKCEVCGETMSLINKGEKGGRILTCNGRRKSIILASGEVCSNKKNWKLDETEKLILDNVSRANFDNIIDDKSEKVQQLEDDIMQSKRELHSTESIKTNMLEAFKDMNDATIIAKIKQLSDKTVELKAKLKEQETELNLFTNSESSIKIHRDNINNIKQSMNDINIDEHQLYILRSKLSQEIQRVIKCLYFSDEIKVSYNVSHRMMSLNKPALNYAVKLVQAKFSMIEKIIE